MEEDGEKLQLNANLSCKVCGEKEFEERDGFYYCIECGTKQDQVRHIELEHNDDNKKAKKLKIQTVKAEKRKMEIKYMIILILKMLCFLYSSANILGML